MRAAPLSIRLSRILVLAALAFALTLVGAGVWWLGPRPPVPDARLTEPPLARVIPDTRRRSAGHEFHDVVLETADGARHRALVRVPLRAEPPFAAVIAVGGIESARRCIRYVPESDRPIVWAAVDYPYSPPPTGTAWSYARELPNASDGVETMVGALRMLLTHLESREDVDPQRTLILGGSLGSTFAVLAAAVDERFEGVVVLGGGEDLERIVAVNLPFDAAWKRRGTAMLLRPWLSPFEPARFAGRIAPRPYFQVHGTADDIIPPECGQALFDAAGEPREIVWFDMPHVIGGNEAFSRPVEAAVMGWMQREGFLPEPSGPTPPRGRLDRYP